MEKRQLNTYLKVGKSEYIITLIFPATGASIVGCWSYKYSECLIPKHMYINPKNDYYEQEAERRSNGCAAAMIAMAFLSGLGVLLYFFSV